MTEGLIPHFRRLAQYNRLANERVYDVCSVLTDKERKQSRSGFFGSIHGTLNHILLGDRIWMTRFKGGEAPSTNLDSILYEGFGELRKARSAEDARIEAYIGGLEAETLRCQIAYVNNEGRLFRDPVAILVAHLFNHQTHHRGQVTAMLAETDTCYPVLDLHRILIPEPLLS